MTTRTTMPRQRARLPQERLKAKRRYPETDEQRALIRWARLHAGKYPQLALLFHIPNERRDAWEAKRLKGLGVLAGVPDIFLPVASHDMHGLFIEMKAPGRVPSNAQNDFLDAVHEGAYMTAICYSWVEAANEIIAYLGLPLEVK